MIKSLTFALALALPATLAAQTSTTDVYGVELAPYGLTHVALPVAVETDGIVATQEWLIHDLDTDTWVILGASSTGVCLGERFPVKGPWVVQRINGLDAFTRLIFSRFEVMPLAQFAPRGC